MSSGGARARSGPAPEVDAQGRPTAIRRGKDAEAGWTHLPAEGRQGETPAWPLTRMSSREGVLWAELWTRPQAVRWELDRIQLEVAMYVRVLARAERPKAPASDVKEEKARANALGLTRDGLAKNHWIIDVAASAAAPLAATGTDGAPTRNMRDRLKVVSRGRA